MKLAHLKSLIKHGESELVEFKKSTASLSSGLQTACAFLNSDQGGLVVFGIQDDGKIVGQKVSDKTRKEIASELNNLEPHTKIDVRYIPLTEDLQVIAVIVAPGEKGPYLYDGRPYIRNQSTTQRMTGEEYAYLHNMHNPTVWEQLPNENCTLHDLDRRKIKEVIRLAVDEKRLPLSALDDSIPDTLRKMGLISNEKLTNAATILFCKNQHKQLFQSNIKLARFKGTTKSEFLDNRIFHGNAFNLFEKAMDFLYYCLPIAARIEEGNPNRIETPAIPYKVLREALANALIHRDYSHQGGAVSVAVYDDRVCISNIGKLPKGVTINSLSKAHESVQRNPLVAHAFYLCRKIEKWGRGTLDMIEDCKKSGNPIPLYEEIGGGFSVTFPLKESIRTTIAGQKEQLDLSTLTRLQKEIVEHLKNGPLSCKKLMDAMQTALSERTIQLQLNKLKAMGLVKIKGKTKAVTWHFGYSEY